MTYLTSKSKKNLHLNTLLEIMGEISITCLVAKEKPSAKPAKEVSAKLLLLKAKMIEAFDNLYDSKEVTDETMRILFKSIMSISDDIFQVTTLLYFWDPF